MTCVLASSQVCVNKAWLRECMKPLLWELYADVPSKPLLTNCFRRAASYATREVDLPTPNVNGRGLPPVTRACLLSEGTLVHQYIDSLKRMLIESKWLASGPKAVMQIAKEFKTGQGRHPFDHVQFIKGQLDRNHEQHLLGGHLEGETAIFSVWSTKHQQMRASISQHGASCYHSCKEAFAIGCLDGTVKIWDFATMGGWRESTIQEHCVPSPLAPTTTVSHRSSLAIVPFIRARSREKIVQVFLESGGYLNLATATDRGDAHVWDVTKGEILASIPAAKIHKSALQRGRRDANSHAYVTTLMLSRSTLICGTSCGFIRIFDLRSGKLTHRLAGHPDAVSQIDSRGRVLWSGGQDGSVRWWGGKTAKVLKKSLICEGHVSVLKMDDEVVVAGYSDQGMEAWDVRTQQPLCTFSNAEFGGIQSLQYDNRKIIAVSTTGKAALWKWYSPHPILSFDPPDLSVKFASVCYDHHQLVLGTKCGKLVHYSEPV